MLKRKNGSKTPIDSESSMTMIIDGGTGSEGANIGKKFAS
jgi:hypothetical protein